MKKFAVYGSGYNPNIPTCFVIARTKEEARELAEIKLAGKALVEHIELWALV